jgi:serine/threonine protein kinase
MIALAHAASRILPSTAPMSDPSPHATFVAPDTPELAPLFPGYDIEGLIATGGMGAVYRAMQRSLDRPVAIKILPQEFSKDQAFRAIFEAEAKAMAKLNHPNLIGVYDFGEIAGMLFIIMEYVPGKSLFHSAHGLAVEPAEVVRLATGICHGLAHAHEHGIIHRDIKPSNILLDLEARPKIGDFGLARNTGQLVQEGEEIFGTPHYTAPEVVNAPQSVDHRADIFSVGVLLHELLTGHLPADDPRPPSAIVLCDPRFDAIVRRATDVTPERRYGSALEIANDLQAISTSPGPKVLRATTPRQAPLPGQRMRRPHTTGSQSSKIGVIVLLLIAIAIAGLLYHRLSNALPPPENTHTHAPVAPPPGPGILQPGPGTLQPGPGTIQPGPGTIQPEPPVQPVPQPEPTPREVVNQPPRPDPPPQPLPQPQPDPDPEAHAPSGFDVAEFLDNRARKIMRERSAPLVAARLAELARNLDGYERDLMSEARKVGRTAHRDFYTAFIKTHVAECREDGNSISSALPDSLRNLPNAYAFHADCLRRQLGIEQKLTRELSSLADTYVLGIEKQIERLKETNDPVAIKKLQEEIDSVRENKGYFPGLMTGE